MIRPSQSPPHVSRRHIFFSPHLDDAVLSCGGWIDALCQTQQPVEVITVFAAAPDLKHGSAFARHLYADWQVTTFQQRPHEDEAALGILGVQNIDHWPFQEAPARLDASDQPLYTCYDELTGTLAATDQALVPNLSGRICARYPIEERRAIVLYFPLALGHHVDHQLLFRVGLAIRAQGYSVSFYEDWPYKQNYELLVSDVTHERWHRHVVAAPLDKKIAAALKYTSQYAVMGGSAQTIAQRLTEGAIQQVDGSPAERYWSLTVAAARRLGVALDTSHEPQTAIPFRQRPAPPSARDFRRFLDTFHFNRLEEVLPVGQGLCLDIGCGSGRWRHVIEQRGYRWLGTEYTIALTEKTVAPPGIQADAENMPIRAGSAAAVVSWGVIEYVMNPEQAIAEAARLLEPGGVFCGYSPFLEPTQNASFYGLSARLVRELLRKHGFKDIRVRAGMNGFSIMLWTWLRRWGGKRAGQIAIPLSAALLIPPAALRFYSSWLNWRLGRGGGHGMNWIAQSSLEEFAGYVLFSARKPAQANDYKAAAHEPGLFLP